MKKVSCTASLRSADLTRLLMFTTTMSFVFTPSLTAIAQESSDLPLEVTAEKKEAGTADVLDKVVITGSRIPRAEFESLQPITTVSSETLERRAAVNLADILNEQPVFATPRISSVGEQEDDVGQNFADIYGLGAQRTLTLVNGQRFPAGVSPASGGGLQVDLNAIPLGLIERVETIAVGGAPIYGTDAIAGTVNIILKEDFEGLEYDASYGFSPEFNDAAREKLSLAFGKNIDDGRGNITIAGFYDSSDGLLETDRPVTADGLLIEGSQIQFDPTIMVDSANSGPLFFTDEACFNTICFNPTSSIDIGLPGAGIRFQPNGIPLDINDPESPLAQFDADGNLIPFVPGTSLGGPIFASGGDGLDLNDLRSLYTDTDRHGFNAFVNYHLTDSIQLKLEGWFGRTTATELINQPEYNSPAFGGTNTFGNVGSGTIPVRIDNPFIPDSTRASILAALNVVQDADGDGFAEPTIDTDGDGVPDTVGFGRFGGLSSLMGNNPDMSQRDTYRFVSGLNGDVDFGIRNFVWDLTYTYGRTQSEDTRTGILQSNFEQAINAVPDLNGDAACADPSNGCVPLNIIGRPTQEAIDYVTARVVDEVVIEQHVFSGNMAGDVFDLPSGAVSGAVGFAYRSESAEYNPSALGSNGFLRNPSTPVSGSFESSEVYGEVVVPLLGGNLETPLVEALDFEAAVRLVDNSMSGTDTTYTVGGRYQVIPDLEFRGNFTRSIRSPSITELFTPTSVVFEFADDPCDQRFIDSGNFPERRAANCASDGLPNDFNSVVVNASQQGTLSGNPDLNVETADSITYGFIAQPRFVPGLSLAVDWVDIEIAEAIDNLSLIDVMEGCYDSAAFPNEPLCDDVQRDASGQVSGFQSGFRNISSIEFSGIQSVASYEFDVPKIGGDMAFNLSYLYTDENVTTRGSGDPTDTAGNVGQSQHRTNLSATYSRDKWTFFSQGRFISEGLVRKHRRRNWCVDCCRCCTGI